MKKFIISVLATVLILISLTSCKQPENSKNGNGVVPGCRSVEMLK